jgi:IS30 family transposase
VRLQPEELDAVWERLKAGMAAKPAARELGLPEGTVRAYLVRCGGIRPVPRRRGVGRLSLVEREEISRGLAAGLSLRVIAGQLGRAASTISREVNGDGGRRRYRALRADRGAWERASRPKPCKLAERPRLRDIVEGKLRRRWSPEQISGWLARTYANDPEMQVSHESIYRTLFVQTRGALRRGVDPISAHRSGVAPPQGRSSARWPGRAAEHAAHLRTPGRGRRPGGAWALGG